MNGPQTTATAVEPRVADAMITQPKTHGPEVRLEEIRGFFRDDHVHMALIVASDGQLLTTIERPDVPLTGGDPEPIAKLGTLAGRTSGPADSLHSTTARLLRAKRRRLAVVDDSGRLLGLLCLKKSGTAYCSDEGVQARAQDHSRDIAASRLPAADPATIRIPSQDSGV
jgi:hypothetical protein